MGLLCGASGAVRDSRDTVGDTISVPPTRTRTRGASSNGDCNPSRSLRVDITTATGRMAACQQHNCAVHNSTAQLRVHCNFSTDQRVSSSLYTRCVLCEATHGLG